MRNSNMLRAVVVALGIFLGTFNSGCDVPNTASHVPPETTAEPAPIAEQKSDKLDAQSRERQDADRLLLNQEKDKNISEESVAADEPDEGLTDQNADPEPEKQTIEIPDSWKRLGKKEEIWIDTASKEVIIAGRVCLNQGPLEMFICPEHTKEHESVIAANATALQVHLALTALGADPGKPTTWDPEYRAAYGPTIDVTLKWQDKDTKATKTASANQWIRDMKTKKPMEQRWVFGGSQFWEDPDTKEQIYYGDGGELICLSNFSTATIDLNVESSQSNEGLLFEAFTENIPPVGTKVYAIIKPGERIEPAAKPETKTRPQNDGDKPASKTQDQPEDHQSGDDQ